MGNFNVNLSYPFSPDFYYETRLKRINLDERRKQSIISGKGFIISNPQSTLKKDMKDPNSIFSSKFGQTLQDVNPFGDRYKCECGYLTSRINHDIECPICHKKVKYIDDDFGIFGWIVLKDPYYIIHPNLYKSMEYLIGGGKFDGKNGSRLDNILKPVEQKDEDGHTIGIGGLPNGKQIPADQPFYGIGILEFKERFEEIMDYYLKKNPNKKDYYDDIIENKDNIFTQSVPVYTTHLRPFKIDGVSFHFEGVNAIYNMISKLSSYINKDDLKMFRKKKTKNQLLYDMHIKYLKLYGELEEVLAGKKGTLRSVFGGRYNFSSRNVIVPNETLRIDEVTMPYAAMVELLQQTIINILHKTYNITYNDAYNIWAKAQLVRDDRVWQIIEGLIKDSGRGIPVIINRNPTIQYGSLLQMYVVGITDTYTLALPLQILPLIAGDFDGDVLNVLYIINESFKQQAIKILNPRNAMYISRNDGKMNPDVNHTKDLLINANALIRLGRTNYTQEQVDRIRQLQNMLNLAS